MAEEARLDVQRQLAAAQEDAAQLAEQVAVQQVCQSTASSKKIVLFILGRSSCDLNAIIVPYRLKVRKGFYRRIWSLLDLHFVHHT
jgi:hypothetical protein